MRTKTTNRILQNQLLMMEALSLICGDAVYRDALIREAKNTGVVIIKMERENAEA